MTNKEKRELKDGVISIFKRFNILDHTATIGGLRDDILRYINSLQEEPVSVWHDASEKPIKGKIILVVQDNGFPFVCDVRNDIGYVSLSFDHSNKTKIDGKDKWAYIEDLLNLSNIERTVKDLKEPVSEDLEEAAHKYADGENPVCLCEECLIKTFKAGARWKEEQVMAKAIDGEILENYDGKVIKYDDTILDEKLSDCKVFDKVKIIVIKEG